MNPSEKPPGSGKERADPAAKKPQTAQRDLPDTDMQPEDTGTAASGAAERGTAAQSVMKQTSKTRNESGSHR